MEAFIIQIDNAKISQRSNGEIPMISVHFTMAAVERMCHNAMEYPYFIPAKQIRIYTCNVEVRDEIASPLPIPKAHTGVSLQLIGDVIYKRPPITHSSRKEIVALQTKDQCYYLGWLNNRTFTKIESLVGKKISATGTAYRELFLINSYIDLAKDKHSSSSDLNDNVNDRKDDKQPISDLMKISMISDGSEIKHEGAGHITIDGSSIRVDGEPIASFIPKTNIIPRDINIKSKENVLLSVQIEPDQSIQASKSTTSYNESTSRHDLVNRYNQIRGIM